MSTIQTMILILQRQYFQPGMLIKNKFLTSPVRKYSTQPKSEYDAVIVGGGHNGLVAAAYLSRAGKKVCVLERRHIIGGAAVTEEIIPGFRFSRASYVLSLLRPQIYRELELKKYGLKLYLRDPSSYTPLREDYIKNKEARSLMLALDGNFNRRQISKFSTRDAEAFTQYEKSLLQIVKALTPMMDVSSHKLMDFLEKPLWQKAYKTCCDPDLRRVVFGLNQLKTDTKMLYQFLTSPILDILNQRFESEPLKATLATDALIGVMAGCKTPGTGYGLLHHMMGEVEDLQSVWAYPEGGMGSVSQAIAKSAESSGAQIFVNKTVTNIKVDSEHNVTGVETNDGLEIKTTLVLSNATPEVTFQLLPKDKINKQYLDAVQKIDYTSPVTKINVALSSLPNFLADKNIQGQTMPHHQTTIHLNCENCSLLDEAFNSGSKGELPSRPMIEMVIPSTLDPTIAPKGAHVCLLFTQFTPYNLAGGKQWDEATKEEYAENVEEPQCRVKRKRPRRANPSRWERNIRKRKRASGETYINSKGKTVKGKECGLDYKCNCKFDCNNLVFKNIEEYAPGFKNTIIGKEVLSPPDLEETFGLTGGNIFHGAMQLQQMLLNRPVGGLIWNSPETPLKGLLICGAGIHPGGGVTGAPGRLAALHALEMGYAG